MKNKKQIKTIRDQIMQLPDPLNHLAIEFWEESNFPENLNMPPFYNIYYIPKIDRYISPLGFFDWPNEYYDMLVAISMDAIHNKVWEEKK